MLTAAAIVLHIAEAQLPPLTSVPGVKLGIANIVTLAALVMAGKKNALLVLLARIAMGGVFSGQVMSLVYSLAGGLASFGAYCLILPLLGDGQLWAAGVAGALAHIAGQLAAACTVLGSLWVLAYAPLLFLAAIVSGAFTGLCAQALIARLKKSKNLRDRFRL